MAGQCRAVQQLWLLGCVVAAAGSGPWEWAATFDLPAGHYTWSMTRNKLGAYPDSTAKLLVLAATGTSQSALEALESAANDTWSAGSGTVVSAYGDVEVGTLYSLEADAGSWTTHFQVHIDSSGSYAVFFEHTPYEFENGFHFFRSEAGEDVEPVVEEDGHGHGAQETSCPWAKDWRWSGLFAVQPGFYDWNAEKVDGEYADAHMNIVILTHTSEPSLKDLEAQVNGLWGGITWRNEISPGGTIPVNVGRMLHFDDHFWASHYKIQIPAGVTHVSVFAQFDPADFERDYHFLRSAEGDDVEAVAVDSAEGCGEEGLEEASLDRWGEVIAGSLVTVLPTLLGILAVAAALVPRLASMAEGGGAVVAAISSFASGVLFAAAVFLLLPEGLYLIAVGKTEAGAAGAWGTAILSAWVFCVAIKHFTQLICGEGNSSDAADDDKAAGSLTRGTDWSVAFPILFGDLFHNFADGLVIGTAFKTCGPDFAWKLIAITVLHETPQEVSDFAVLVTRGRMHWGKATLLNFLSGLSTVVGAIITYAAEVSYGAEGVILAAGAGVYLYVAMTELGPAVSDLEKGERGPAALSRLLVFAIGATLIGLVLLDHEHCIPESSEDGGENDGGDAEDPHAGHNHR